MEDWLEMLIVIVVVIGAMVGYLVYLGVQIAGLQGAISDYSDMQQAISDAQGSQDTSPVTSPFSIITKGLGG
jgi:hypothetical protein